MKYSTRFCLYLLTLPPLAIAQVVPLSGDWYLVDGAADNTLTATTADADTIAVSQPAVASGGRDRGAVTYLGSSVSLTDVGDFIQFSGDYSGDVGNNINYAIRIGFYNSNGSVVSSDFSSASDSWIGLWTASANRSSTGARSNNLYQPSNTDKVLDIGDTSPETEIGGFVTDITTGNRTITFRITKTSATELSLRLVSGGVDHTDTLLVSTAPTTTFDAFAVSWRIGSSTISRSAEFDNIAITTVPEPAVTTLLAALGAVLFLVWRRERGN